MGYDTLGLLLQALLVIGVWILVLRKLKPKEELVYRPLPQLVEYRRKRKETQEVVVDQALIDASRRK